MKKVKKQLTSPLKVRPFNDNEAIRTVLTPLPVKLGCPGR
jgi:hypothetical protein